MTAVRAVGVVVPAHDEQQLVGAGLDALRVAAGHPDLAGIAVEVLVVLDTCTDGTRRACDSRGVRTLAVSGRNVGRARAAGFDAFADTFRGRGGVWFAGTDADTRVAPDWLAEQVRLADAGADAVFGVVDVDDWDEHPPLTPSLFADRYAGTARGDPERHGHVHGASMGLRMEAYRRVGGIPFRRVGEDRALSDLLTAEPDLTVVRTTAVRATTSARRVSRVRGGFADLLSGLGAGA